MPVRTAHFLKELLKTERHAAEAVEIIIQDDSELNDAQRNGLRALQGKFRLLCAEIEAEIKEHS